MEGVMAWDQFWIANANVDWGLWIAGIIGIWTLWFVVNLLLNRMRFDFIEGLMFYAWGLAALIGVRFVFVEMKIYTYPDRYLPRYDRANNKCLPWELEEMAKGKEFLSLRTCKP